VRMMELWCGGANCEYAGVGEIVSLTGRIELAPPSFHI
jgi:hypothetical protein